MKDAAAAAKMSDPEQNRWFRRRWLEPTWQLPSHELAPRPVEPEMLGHELLAEWRSARANHEVIVL